MKINFAHLRERSTSGGWINFAVFDAKSSTGTQADNDILLHQLTVKAQVNGLKVDQAALAYREHGHIKFFGSKKLVKYLANNGIPYWTHTIDA